MQENVIETRRNQTELRKLERTKLQIMNKLKEVQLGIRSLGTIEETSLPDVKDLVCEEIYWYLFITGPSSGPKWISKHNDITPEIMFTQPKLG